MDLQEFRVYMIYLVHDDELWSFMNGRDVVE
jgi:hypothetical protein